MEKLFAIIMLLAICLFSVGIFITNFPVHEGNLFIMSAVIPIIAIGGILLAIFKK
jgi:hypothetical protein